MPITTEHAQLKPRLIFPRSACARSAIAAAIAVSVVTLVFVVPLASYWRSYFPYEDDFSLILFSARENNPVPVTWISEGFSRYFVNDPVCPPSSWGFVRPVVNLTHYAESLLRVPAEGPRLMLTNVVCWLVSLILIFALARRLGAERWEAAAALILYGLSPCWYRNLIHSSFRNNGLAACWTLAAFLLMLWSDGGRRRLRWLAAGIVAALAVATHEQALSNIAVLAVVAAYFAARQKAPRRAVEWAVGTALMCVPAIVTVVGFRLLNAAYGHNYATSGFFGSGTGASPPLAVKVAIVALRAVQAVANAPRAFTPSGADNLVTLPAAIGPVIFMLALAAAVAVWWKGRKVAFAAGMMLLYVLGRGFSGFGEPRFTHMEVAWAVLLAIICFSTARRHRIRHGTFASAAAMLGLLGFNLASFRATIVEHRFDLLRRNEADRRSFQVIRTALAEYPRARVLLINEQVGTWAARSMLQLAGAGDRPIEILPTITPWVVSTDFMRDYGACETDTAVEARDGNYFIHVSYPSGCQPLVFGRDLACAVSRFKDQHLASNAEWAACSASANCPAEIRHELRLSPGERALLVSWQSRLTAASVSVIGRGEQSAPSARSAARSGPVHPQSPDSARKRQSG